ncbi:nucleotide exchange factor GrpE [Synechococcus sp. ATX 2A4]|uniref:nucleotide exchange factor GrpE n=1 Tax=Synechococcus sp. ATX 2A4 TaxID=2823727 RepID=UPI0020CCC901|nr:nucleotide exchange factor GrpE [Synechococcus sp. ATX 2A4]MCP9885458.1 nucleotide exchange factor GrpE [Synechococcus sp. ATX 2A4]
MSGEASSFSQDSEAPAEAPQVASTEASVEGLASEANELITQLEASAASAEASVQAGTGSEAGDPQRRVQELEAALSSLRAEHEGVRSQYMRIAADFDNFRKRQSRDQDDLRLKITCSTLAEILPVVDNFDRARQQLDPQNPEAQDVHRSYQGLYKQLVDVFKNLGVSPMRVEGEPFDPNLHEAVLREPSDEVVEDVVIAELQRGYQLEGRVIRHALVKVSMGPGPAGGSSAANAPDGGNEPMAGADPS